MRIQVQSRIGNAVLGVLGVVYAAAGIALLGYELVQTWGAMGRIDYAVALVLLASIAVGVLFVLTAAQNLGLRLRRHEAPHHREGAAAVP